MVQAARELTSKIVLPAPQGAPTSPPPWLRPTGGTHPGGQAAAPAWFYSALAFLGTTYTAGDGSQQTFGRVLGGSDVDPYASLGATRLFLIARVGDGFQLSLAPNGAAPAPLTGGTVYARTDVGVAAMYAALAASPLFASAAFAYLAGAPLATPGAFLAAASYVTSLRGGYDTATGLRSIVLGSAVAQAVPLEVFLETHNTQIYDATPTIVPLFTSLVYDIADHKAPGDTILTLPTVYTRDDLGASGSYVNKQAGATVVAAAGPGYNAATPDAGVGGFTVAGASLLTVFSTQTIAGFHAESGWTNTHGTPIFDFGASNSAFTAIPADLVAPVPVFDPASSTLNGGTLTAVLASLSHADHLESTDRLVSMLKAASQADSDESGGALAVTTAALSFDMSSSPASSLAEDLNVPVTLDVTIAPPVDDGGGGDQGDGGDGGDGDEAGDGGDAQPADGGDPAASHPVERALDIEPIGVIRAPILGIPIGTGANQTTPPAPTTVIRQLGIEAYIPQEALAGTGISSIESGTVFPPQSLGDWGAFSTVATGTIVNIAAPSTDADANPADYPLDLVALGLALASGVDYVVTMTGTAVALRGADGNTFAATLAAAPPDEAHEYVGAFTAEPATTTVTLYPKLPLALAAPAVGTSGVVQGTAYSVRLTWGEQESTYDLVDPSGAVTASGVTVASEALQGTQPVAGTLFFGSVIGGASEMTLWSVPIFAALTPAQLTADGAIAANTGTITVDAVVTGIPSYQLQLTDSSLFIYSNIDIDTGAVGSTTTDNVYLASAVINSAPDDGTSAAFAPSAVLMGIVRPVPMGAGQKYAFIPEDDSVLIGSTRYLLSVIDLDDLNVDPNSRPYPPAYWPEARYWQFANRHNPYLDVSYEGKTQADRVARAQTDVAKIGLGLSASSEPMHMYLDTSDRKMTVWPIYAFPFTMATQSVDQGRLSAITATILDLLKDPVVLTGAAGATGTQAQGTGIQHIANLEQIDVPGELLQTTPYITPVTEADASAAEGDGSSATGGTGAVLGGQTFVPIVQGTAVTNLNPLPSHEALPSTVTALQSTQAKQSEQAAAALSSGKNLIASLPVLQQVDSADSAGATTLFGRRLQPVYGFSVWNPGSGEAYIVEVVEADLTVPDQLPDPTINADYDPYYVRVVFLSSMTAYNMSIIVPTVAYDQFGYFARESTPYGNVLSKTDELGLGYLYSLYDGSNNFDDLRFMPYSQEADVSGNSGAISEPSGTPDETPVVFSNLPYSTQQTAVFNPASLFQLFEPETLAGPAIAAAKSPAPTTRRASRAQAAAAITGTGLLTERTIDLTSILFHQPPTPPPYFVCRRENWSADCHLMQATVPAGTSVYLAFGAGDIVPFRLDKEVVIDKRLPTHLNKLTYTFADRTYDSVQTISVGNTPYVVAVTTQGGVAGYSSFAIEATVGTTDLAVAASTPLTFPTECQVVGQATTTLTSVADLNARLGTGLGSTGDFVSVDSAGNVTSEFAVIPYNNLVYLVRAVTNVDALGALGASGTGLAGGAGIRSGLLIDTFVPSTAGNLTLAQSARYKRSGLSFFGNSYTPTTMVDSLDNLDFTSITGETFYAPTIFVPIPELDASPGFVADLSEFLGEQFWTFIYTEVVAQRGQTVNGVAYPNGLNIDGESRPILSLQKLQFVYDPIAVLFTPNDLSHKYPLAPKQQVLALTNGQVREGIAWRSADVQPGRQAPHNVRAQELIPTGAGMDAANIVYSAHNRPLTTPTRQGYLGMSVHSIRSVSADVYNIEESAFSADQTATGFVSAVSSNANMVIGVLFDYDNNELGSLTAYDPDLVNTGLVFLNGYLGGAGYAFSSPDHVDVDDVLPSQLPLLEQIAGTMGGNWDVAFYNTDASLPRQYWNFSYDARTGPGLPNFLADTPPAPADPAYLNRTRSLLLNLQNPVRPKELGLMDTYSSVVSANLTLTNGVTGSIFLSKKADRDVASIGSTPTGSTTFPLYGLPAKYDFFLFSRDHYGTLDDAQFQLIDQGYAMVLADDGSGTGTKVAKFYVDADGNYYELYSYVLFSPTAGVIETSTFTLKVALGSPANPNTTPATPETPNNVNPQDLLAQINAVSGVLYAAFGASSPGQAPAYLPIQAAGGSEVQAGTIMGAPGFGGYALNVIGANHQPVQVAQLYSAGTAYAIAGTATSAPLNAKGKPIPFYGSLSHGLDKQVSYPSLHSADGSAQIPRATAPQTVTSGLFGGDGLGGLIGSPLSFVFQGSGAIPPQTAADPTPGTTMKADDTVFYTMNALTLGAMDSTGKAATAGGKQYFVDTTDPSQPIYGLINLPTFTINGNTYAVNLATTLSDGITSRYSLIVGGKTYPFGPDNAHVTVNRTVFTFNPIAGGAYTVTYASVDAPAIAEAPTPVALTPFSIVAGGGLATIDVFTNPGGLLDLALGVLGRLYSYDAVTGTVTVSAAAAGGGAATQTVCRLQTGLGFASTSNFAYVIGIDDGEYTVNGQPTVRYNASTTGTPTSYPLMTAPQMFTLGGDFYTFDIAANGAYTSVTGNGQTVPINPYQFSINGGVYIINTNVQPNTVIGGGNTIPMTDGNTQFLIDGAPYTIALKSNALLGATISGQFDIVQGNVVVIEDYVYQLDTLNDQIVGNGAAYPLTTSGFTYTITTTDRSFTVTTEPNATTVLIGGIDYQILDTSVVGDGVTSPILVYRSFTDGAATFDIGFDGTATTPTTFPLSGTAPFVGSTFTDGGTFTVNEPAAFDGSTYFPMTGSPAAFTAAGRTYTVRTDGVSIAAGPTKTYLGGTGAPSPTQFTFGTETIHFGRPTDLASYDGTHYFAIAGNQFTDTVTGLTFILDANTAANGDNTYEIFSNLGATPYFQVPGGSTYEVNVPVADTGNASGDEFSVFPITSGGFSMPVQYMLTVAGTAVSVAAVTFTGGSTVVPTLTAAAGSLTGGYFVDPVTSVTYTVVVDGAQLTVIDSTNTTYPLPAAGTGHAFVASVVVATGVSLAVDNEATPAIYPILNNQFTTPTATYSVNVPVAYENAAGPYWPVVNGRFIVPSVAPLSDLTYTITGAAVTKGYVISADDQFTLDGSVFYTVNAVNVVRADQTGGDVQITYLPETTAYGFTAANGVTYLIHYSDVGVAFPVVSGEQVNAGVATVGANQFDIHVDEVLPLGGGTGIPTNRNSFEVNGNLYSITGTPAGADYSACFVAGDATAPVPFLSASMFRLTDPSITYTLHLDADDLPTSITATFPVQPSRDLITVADDVYLITYATTTTGSLLGQGRASIPIAGSAFTLTNNLDSTKGSFIFDDLDIYDAGSVVGRFTVYAAPTFSLGSVTYSLDPVNRIVRDASKRPYPLLPNPTMFSIAGANYVIDSNRVPHAIVGNHTVSPLSTDVTKLSGKEVPNSTFTLGGQIYKYVEDAHGSLLAITGTRLYPIAAPGLTFKLDSSLIFTLSTTAPAAGNYAGTDVPIGTVTSGTTVLNVYTGRPESGGAPFFVYKNALYTLLESAGGPLAVQKTYTVYAASPAASQRQLAVFDTAGGTYLVTTGSTTGSATPSGINPGTLWAQTSVTAVETQFGLVSGYGTAPIAVTETVQPSGATVFQFPVTAPTGIAGTSATTLYDVLYTAGGNANLVQVDVPLALPSFSQMSPFTFVPSVPLELETGGYNAFTTFVDETSTPAESFAGAFTTPIVSSDPKIDGMLTPHGDFSMEFWHSIPSTTPLAYHPATFSASTSANPVFHLDLDFEDSSHVYVGINDTVLGASVTPPVFSSRWQHVALSYTQPYVMLCQGDGFEVKDGTNYNVTRDFSVALTFSASDVTTPQGLVYKGTGSDIPSPEWSSSYRVAVEDNRISLTIKDAAGGTNKFLSEPAVDANNFYEVVIVKQSASPLGHADSTDPYAPPFGKADLGNAASNGGSANVDPPIGSGSGAINITGLQPGGTSATNDLIKSLGSDSSKQYTVTFAIRALVSNGTFGAWSINTITQSVSGDPGLQVASTGGAHVLLGSAYDDNGQKMALGSTASPANLRDVYIFGSAIDHTGVASGAGTVPISRATMADLTNASIAGYWRAAYDPNGIVDNPVNQNDVAVSTNARTAALVPLTGHEYEGAKLYINGYLMNLGTLNPSDVPASMSGYQPGSSSLVFAAGRYKLQEISVWRMARQAYQVIDDMFGRLVPTNEPDLILYISGSFVVQNVGHPILPLNSYIDHIAVNNEVATLPLAFSPASLDLSGSPAVGRCGPLITPNLYTPPGAALTICDAPPSLTTYSVTVNDTTGTLAGELNEAYAYVKDNVLMLYAGKKIGDLVLSWVSQEQGDVQLIGYVEGAPPAPLANLTNKASYAGATSLTFTAATSIALKYAKADQLDTSNDFKLTGDLAAATNPVTGASAVATTATGAEFNVKVNISPVGVGVHNSAVQFQAGSEHGGASATFSITDSSGTTDTASNKLDESNRYTVKLQGAMAPYTGDQLMASLNTVSTPSTTPGVPAAKSPILPDPSTGGFTASNPPGQLPKTAVTDERFGSRPFLPSPYGQAFVTSQTEDVYQQTLLQSNTVYGFVRIPNAQIPRDLNIVSFRLSSAYLRPGVLDGVVGYTYNPATLPTGGTTWTTSTGELQELRDANFSEGEIGHNASYMRVVEAYALKRQIDQEAFTALALYNTAYNPPDGGDRPASNEPQLTPALDFYNEYIWTARGGTQEVKHTYSTSYDEVVTTASGTKWSFSGSFDLKLMLFGVRALTLGLGYTYNRASTTRYSYTTTGGESFDITASFDGLETDTQMRYASANDVHFVMRNNSMYNPTNESGVNLVIGSDGLVYDMVPSVASGSGLPLSNDIDTSHEYTQPQPSYTTGNADGDSGALVPYDRPGKTKQFRTLAFFLQPARQNADDFWNEVVDPVWLANSPDADAVAMRSAAGISSMPWRLLYRVTYSERFLPPVDAAPVVVPQITPLMAVPVLNPASDFLYQAVDGGAGGAGGGGAVPRPARNPANDIEANLVLVAPTASGVSAGTVQTAGPNPGQPLPPNNVIPFDLLKLATPIVNWGDSANSKLLSQLITSALGQTTVPMSRTLLPGSTLVQAIADPVNGGVLYSTYVDPNGLTVNVPTNPGIQVFQDVNGNPVSFFDGKSHHSLQADYVPSPDGSVMYYIQPPSTYDQTAFDPLGDYDPLGHPGDEWRYYLVSGFSSDMTSDPTVTGSGPFLVSSGVGSAFTGATIASAQHAVGGANQVRGYLLVRGILQWPNLNATAETFGDLAIYKSMSLLDTFPIGDPEVLRAFLAAEYPDSAFAGNDDISTVFARNIVSYFNTTQQGLTPQ